MNGIAIYIVTKDTKAGNHCGFKLLMREGCKASIAWGDGVVDTCMGGEEWKELAHEYPGQGFPYFISIFSEEDNSILGFQDAGMSGVKTVELNISPCPSLRHLRYENQVSVMIDTSRNPKLLDLKIGSNKILPLCNSVAMQSALDRLVEEKKEELTGMERFRRQFHRYVASVFAFARQPHFASFRN